MSEPIRRYVAGFLFRHKTPVSKEVLLVRKTHPKWQANLLNGIGGEIEGIETSKEAMIREFSEEANYMTNAWEYFANESGPGYSVFFFRHTLDPKWEDKHPYESPEFNDKGEGLEWHYAHAVQYPVIGNLRWLLPLALDPRPIECSIETKGDIRKIMTW
jgi:8-oxo-dGTP pyrophosphatase MutT (NUDIX family)